MFYEIAEEPTRVDVGGLKPMDAVCVTKKAPGINLGGLLVLAVGYALKPQFVGSMAASHHAYSRVFSRPGSGIGYLPSASATSGDSDSRVSLSMSGANSCSQFIICSRVIS